MQWDAHGASKCELFPKFNISNINLNQNYDSYYLRLATMSPKFTLFGRWGLFKVQPCCKFGTLGQSRKYWFFNGAIPASFSFFLFFLDSKWQIITFKDFFWQCWDLNYGSLVLEATALPTAPQPPPDLENNDWSVTRGSSFQRLLLSITPEREHKDILEGKAGSRTTLRHWLSIWAPFFVHW